MTTSHHQPYHTRESGIALFIAIIFASVVLLTGLTMASFGYKQVILSSSTVSSQKAYYSADSALECVLYADQQLYAFKNGASGTIYCSGGSHPFTGATITGYYKYTITNIKNASINVCADAVVYKTKSTPYKTYIFSTGYYNVDQAAGCSINTHTTVRGISTRYGS